MEGLMVQEDELLTSKEAAAYLKLSPKSGYITLTRLVRSNLVKAGRIGNFYRFRKQDLDDFVFAKR